MATKKANTTKKKTASKLAAKKVKKAVAKKAAAPKKKPAAKAKVAVKKTSPAAKPAPRSQKVTPKKNGLPPMILSANDNEVIANAKVRYGSKDLDMFKKVLMEQRDEAKEEFDIISEQLLDTSGEFDGENQSFALHTAEQGSDAMEREKQYLQAQRASDYIKKLDEALERIDRGTYGICVVCGRLIEKQRLYAVPITQKHVDCKNKTNAKRFSVEPGYGQSSSLATSDDVLD